MLKYCGKHFIHVLTWGDLGLLHSEKSLLQEITSSAGHLWQCAHRHPSLPFLRTKKAHLSHSLVSLPSLLTPWHMGTCAHADVHTRDLNFPFSPGGDASTATTHCS